MNSNIESNMYTNVAGNGYVQELRDKMRGVIFSVKSDATEMMNFFLSTTHDG